MLGYRRYTLINARRPTRRQKPLSVPKNSIEGVIFIAGGDKNLEPISEFTVHEKVVANL